VSQSYVVVRPDGTRIYVKNPRPLAYVVFVRRLSPPEKWQRVQVVENRPYEDERHRVDGSYVTYPGPMPPHVKALEVATWWREVIGNHEVAVAEAREARGKRRML
jgi:hypothetical protein